MVSDPFIIIKVKVYPSFTQPIFFGCDLLLYSHGFYIRVTVEAEEQNDLITLLFLQHINPSLTIVSPCLKKLDCIGDARRLEVKKETSGETTRINKTKPLLV
jgi:hypothetical protein